METVDKINNPEHKKQIKALKISPIGFKAQMANSKWMSIA